MYICITEETCLFRLWLKSDQNVFSFLVASPCGTFYLTLLLFSSYIFIGFKIECQTITQELLYKNADWFCSLMVRWDSIYGWVLSELRLGTEKSFINEKHCKRIKI